MRALMLDGGDRTPYLSRLVARLAARGVAMHYAADPRFKDFDALGAAGVTCHAVRVRHKLDYPARFALRRLLDRHAIDVLHTITGRDAYVGLRARGRRRIRTVVRRGAYAPISRLDPSDRLVYGRRGADRIVAVSHDLRRHMVDQGLASERVATIYTGIWSDALEPRAADLRAAHGVSKDALLLGVVGNLRPVKGFDDLLDALAHLRGGPRLHLLVAGSGYDAVDLRGLPVTLLGHVQDVMAFTPNLDVLVVPSRIDALPRVAIEATVVGTPVVGTRVGGIPEILDDGRGGVLTDPLDPRALAEALEAAARDPGRMRALADHARARNRELFGLDGCVEAHLQLYDALRALG